MTTPRARFSEMRNAWLSGLKDMSVC